MKIKEMWKQIICFIFAGLFIYGKYFVDVTEIEKLSSTVSCYAWILLALIIYIMDEISRKEDTK